MKIRYKSNWYKIRSVLRWYWARIAVPGFICTERSMIGERCGIFVEEGGEIKCKGRIIVNDDVMLYSKGQLTLGENLGVNKYSRIVAHEQITIGNNVTIGQMVSILDHDHAYHMNPGLKLDGYTSEPIRVGDNVWIGDKVSVLKGVTVGSNVIIGAHSIVTKDIPSNVIVAGNPLKIIKELK